MTAGRLIDQHRRAWDAKPTLRAIYADYHRSIAAKCIPGRTVEIGGGSGHMKTVMPDVTSIDLQHASWLDVIADAHQLPIANGSIANIVMLDVLHHLRFPVEFMREAARVLQAGGRLVMIEPEMTPVSKFFLSRFHPEPVNMSATPLTGDAQSTDDPEDANQAVPYILFRRDAAALAERVPELRIVTVDRMSLWAYPMSGGFRPWNLLPAVMVEPLLFVERVVMPVVGPAAAFRMLVVLERAP